MSHNYSQRDTTNPMIHLYSLNKLIKKIILAVHSAQKAKEYKVCARKDIEVGIAPHVVCIVQYSFLKNRDLSNDQVGGGSSIIHIALATERSR
jgi:hypothetical protein